MAQLPRPAAVNVAAAEEYDAAWAEALDVDDSDLRLSPPSPPCSLCPSTAATPHPDKPSRSSHGQRIPGPASAVQDAMRLRESGVFPVLERADAQAVDTEFLRYPWLCALQFLVKDHAWERPGIKRIKADRELHRAPLVMGVVTSCKPNGLGDLFLTLKDPTDSICASVHRKVLLEGNGCQDISTGCVILLNKVAVFRPSHTACYLNITKGKVVKVVRKDCDPPLKQEISSGTTGSQLHAAMWKETQWVAHLEDRPLGTSQATASIFSKMVSRTKGSQVADLHSEGDAANFFCGATLGLDINERLSNYCASQQSLKILNRKNQDTWHQIPGENLPMFERRQNEDSANIMMERSGHEKMMPSCKEMTVAEVSCHHQGTIHSSKSTSAHKLSSYINGCPQQSSNIPNTCSQLIAGASSAILGVSGCTQASNNEKPRLPFADQLMLPSSKKPKTNAALPPCYNATMNTSIDTKRKHDSEDNMDIDVHDMAETFHGGHSSTVKPDECQQKDLCAANTSTAQPTKETDADAAAANNRLLLSHPKRVISVASVASFTDWNDEQLSELFADY